MNTQGVFRAITIFIAMLMTSFTVSASGVGGGGGGDRPTNHFYEYSPTAGQVLSLRYNQNQAEEPAEETRCIFTSHTYSNPHWAWCKVPGGDWEWVPRQAFRRVMKLWHQ